MLGALNKSRMLADAAVDSGGAAQPAGAAAHSGGASQPARAMQPLGALNKSSGRLATFAVRLSGARKVDYTYKNKKDQQEVLAHKFEAWLVGQNPEHYCIGYIKGSKRVCQEAYQKYQSGTVWALSRVSFDTWTAPTYISTPIAFRVDLANSTLRKLDGEICAIMPQHPVPPRSVAEVARITTNRSTDLIAVVKSVSTNKRKSNSNEEIVDVELVDNSVTPTDKLATIVISVFGTKKIQELSDVVGTPMAFFNLSIACPGPGAKPTINHYDRELVMAAPECGKTVSLREKQKDLARATNTESLTAAWTPNLARDVSGPQPLSCTAFLDFTSECPEAPLPAVSQLMWVHIEEPASGAEVLDGSASRIWYHVPLRDISGSVLMGIPQRCALVLARCSTMEEFMVKHEAGELNMPLLCHARISRSIREKDGASQPVQFVNHTLEMVEPVSWRATSAPNAAFTAVLGILNNCPQHDEGIHFAFLADIQPDPYYGMRIVYDDTEGPRGLYVAALVASSSKSKTSPVSDDGYKVVTTAVKDIANPDGTLDNPISAITPS